HVVATLVARPAAPRDGGAGLRRVRSRVVALRLRRLEVVPDREQDLRTALAASVMHAEPRSRLVTLGGLALTRGERQVDGKAVRRRQLALLALLASAGERGLTRDQLLVRLWGDSVEEKARHSLDQAISELRKALGKDAIVRAGAGLRLNPSLIDC